jgi:large subunit ribosomal protein L24
MKVYTGDTVLIISGKDRGKTGTIIKVLSENLRVVVSGINMRTKHIRKTPQQAGRKVRYEASIAASNVMLLDPKTKKPTRIGFRIDADAGKVRIAKVSGEVVEKGKMAKMESKESKESKEEKEGKEGVEKVEAPKKQPFWKKLGFGAAEAVEEEAEVPETPRGKEDHTIPGEQMHVRTGQRGS